MRKISEYLVLALLVCACLFPACRRARVIGERDLSDIYAEMFLADQWLNDNSLAKRKADTTRFYETIFRKFGYTFADYDASVNYYLNRPEKYKKIVERAQKKLRATQKSLESFESTIEKQNNILKGLGYLHLPVFAADSIKVDTTMIWAPWRDTLTVRDSMMRERFVQDSLRRDSLMRDSLRRDSLKRQPRLHSIKTKEKLPIVAK